MKAGTTGTPDAEMTSGTGAALTIRGVGSTTGRRGLRLTRAWWVSIGVFLTPA
ncbi:MAG: hypothetical protein L3K03_00480 [Thermoplasmata archaeon]|nr:hypothetical protein [Thermoplasmata archaeon]